MRIPNAETVAVKVKDCGCSWLMSVLAESCVITCRKMGVV
jgi:hypothetical protein